MKKSSSTIITCSILGAILIGALVYYNFIDKGKTQIHEGNQVGDKCLAQDIQLINGEDGTWNVQNNIDKISVINFWGTWCTPCVEELPHFNEVFELYKDNVDMIAIHQQGYDEREVNQFIQQRWSDYNIHFGLDSEENEYFINLGGKSIWPMTVIVDQEGIIQYTHQGKVEKELLEQEVLSLIKIN